MIRYKLTDNKGNTRSGPWGQTVWQEGATYRTLGGGAGRLCTSSWLHCYSDPLLAVLFNPIHANFVNPKLCEVECSGESLNDYGTKEGWTTMSFVRWIDLPLVSTEQRVAFGLVAASDVARISQVDYVDYLDWADGWLNGSERKVFENPKIQLNNQSWCYDAVESSIISVDYFENSKVAAYANSYAACAASNAAHAGYMTTPGIVIKDVAYKALELFKEAA